MRTLKNLVLAMFFLAVLAFPASALPPVGGFEPMGEPETIDELEDQGEYPNYAIGELRRITQEFLGCVNSYSGTPASRIQACRGDFAASGKSPWFRE